MAVQQEVMFNIFTHNGSVKITNPVTGKSRDFHIGDPFDISPEPQQQKGRTVSVHRWGIDYGLSYRHFGRIGKDANGGNIIHVLPEYRGDPEGRSQYEVFALMLMFPHWWASRRGLIYSAEFVKKN